jgi:hypothetical protein
MLLTQIVILYCENSSKQINVLNLLAKYKMKQQIVRHRNHCARRVVGINGINIKNVQKELQNTQNFAKKVFENNCLCTQTLRIIQHVPHGIQTHYRNFTRGELSSAGN